MYVDAVRNRAAAGFDEGCRNARKGDRVMFAWRPGGTVLCPRSHHDGQRDGGRRRWRAKGLDRAWPGERGLAELVADQPRAFVDHRCGPDRTAWLRARGTDLVGLGARICWGWVGAVWRAGAAARVANARARRRRIRRYRGRSVLPSLVRARAADQSS